MSSGVGVGLLLVWLLQAEHVGCSWAAEVQSSENNKHPGFLQQAGRPRTLGFYPQNQVRQVVSSPRSVQSSSFNSEPAGPSGSGPGLPASSYTRALSQPVQNSVRPMKSSLVSKPDWQMAYSEKVDAPAVPQRSSGLSSSVSQNQKALNELNKRRTWSSQQVAPRASKSPASSSTSKMPFYERTDLSSVLFSPVGPAPHGSSAWMQTYARGPAKRVSSRHSYETPKATSFKSHTGVEVPYVSQYSVTGPKTEGHKSSYASAELTSRSRIPVQGARNLVSRSSEDGGFAPSAVQEIPDRFGGSAIRRLAVQKPQEALKPPPQRVAQHKPKFPNVNPKLKWSRV